MAMGECSVYSSLQAGSKVKFAALPTSWQPPGTDRLLLRGPKVNSSTWFCTVDMITPEIWSSVLLLLFLAHKHKVVGTKY